MLSFTNEDIVFHYLDKGEGIPFIFQPGIGGDVNQPFGVFKPAAGIRLLAFDSRAHGKTWPVGPVEKLNFSTFADDLIAFMDHLQIGKAIVGGISMGAGVALNTAVRYPERVQSLVLSRPAWLEGSMTDLAIFYYDLVVDLLKKHGPAKGQHIFLESDEYRKLKELSPDVAKSMAGQLVTDKALDFIARLERLPREKILDNFDNVNRLQVPTLVIATKQDPIHVFEWGQKLAKSIPDAQFKEVTPKSANTEQHVKEVQESISQFIENRSFVK
jgi:pimeloyl-ACP methyl ester carboxylesterase